MTFSGDLPRKKAPGTWSYKEFPLDLLLDRQALFLSLSAGGMGESGCLIPIPRLKPGGQEEFEASGLSF